MLDLVVFDEEGEVGVSYEVVEEFWDDTRETKSFKKQSKAETYFARYVEMVE